LAILTALIFPIMIMSRKYFLRPKSMDFNDEGIVFQFPLKRLWTAKWMKISEIFLYRGDPKNTVGSPNFGIIKVKGRIAQIELTFEATKMIRDEYFKRYGTEVNRILVERKAHGNH
jgi:hypothetical protein